MMVLLMVVCRMLPIYFAEDKTLEISFVPVLACAIRPGGRWRWFCSGYRRFSP